MNLLTNKIQTRGIGSLTDAELLSLLLDEGSGTMSAEELAARLLSECGSLANIARTDVARLRMTEGVGMKRAVRIAAAAELGRRIMKSRADETDTIASSEDVVRIFRPIFDGMRHEECWVLYLTNTNRIIERGRVSQGGVQGTVVDRRLIAKRALELLATQVIMVHNHPSGDPRPSDNDRQLTRQIGEALQLFDIRLLDHLIISSDGRTFSFNQNGEL